MKNLSLGKKIKSIRTSKGFSQEEMADELNISLSSYRRIEQNITDTSVSTVEKIAKVLNISAMEIFAFGSDYITEGSYKKINEDLEKEIRKLEKVIIEKDKEIINLQKKLLKVEKSFRNKKIN